MAWRMGSHSVNRPRGVFPRAVTGAALGLTNLLNDVDTLSPLFVDRIAAGDTLNAYLVAAGMQQIAEDHLHRDPFFLHRAAGRLRRRVPAPLGQIASTMARGAGGLLWQGIVRTPRHRALAAWLDDMTLLGQRLAAQLMEKAQEGELRSPPDLEAEARSLAVRVSSLLPSLRRGLLRLPSCFRSFDQEPEDMEMLAAAFAQRWPDMDRALLVVGIRSSGCYLAPIVAASLRRLGFGNVRAATLRPGQRWLGRETRLVRQTAEAGGLALVVDDPPRSWASVIGAVRELGRLGFNEGRTILVLATFGDAAEPPPALQAHPAVLLPFSDWAVHRCLEPDRIGESLSSLLGNQTEVVAVHRVVEVPEGPARGHVRAVYEVDLRSAGATSRRFVQARGVGLGYFGEHALAVAARLVGRITQVYGLDNGVLLEAWPPPASRLGPPLAERQVAALAGYVAERARVLPLPEDLTERLLYRGAAWQWAGSAFGGLFGRASELGRLLGTATARRLLKVERPAVIDNRTQLDAFADAPAGDGVVKCDFDVGVFSSDDLHCFDPVSDVALAAVSADSATGHRLRHEYEAATGRPVGAERWLLYQLVHVLASQEKQPAALRQVDLRPARLFLHYYREVLLADLEPGAAGPLCAIDLDGVLESMPLGFPATSPAGALALRALHRHGYRPVLATGRSLDEVRDRCAAYSLPGGVAEYGAVVYLHGSGEVRSLQEPAEREALDRLGATLSAARDVHVDPAFRYSVRAFRLDARGRRHGLTAERVAEGLAATADGMLRPVPGHYQTDFVGAATGKARGLRVLARELGVRGEQPLALAVGDTASDLEMLHLAQLRIAPGNADQAVRSDSGITVVRPPAQAGLAEAVARLVGHRPGSCPVCAPPPLTSSSRLLLDLLSVEDLSRWRRVARAGRLVLALRESG